MAKQEASIGGILVAAAICLVATVGTFLTTARSIESLNWLWLTLFAVGILTSSAAAVNFDRKRWLR